jgi:hypothetical protein
MVELPVPRQRGAVVPPAAVDGTSPSEPTGSVSATGRRLSRWCKELLRGADPNLATVSFEAYYFDGAHS